MNRFTQKVVVITGAGSGIGAATAKRFAREGASVVLVGRNREKLANVAAQLSGAEHLIRATDVADLTDVEALFKEVAERFGRLDVLVNNAGVATSGKSDRTGRGRLESADVRGPGWRVLLHPHRHASADRQQGQHHQRVHRCPAWAATGA